MNAKLFIGDSTHRAVEIDPRQKRDSSRIRRERDQKSLQACVSWETRGVGNKEARLAESRASGAIDQSRARNRFQTAHRGKRRQSGKSPRLIPRMTKSVASAWKLTPRAKSYAHESGLADRATCTLVWQSES